MYLANSTQKYPRFAEIGKRMCLICHATCELLLSRALYIQAYISFRGDYECEGSEHEVVDKESGWVKKVAKKRVVGDGSSGGNSRSESRRAFRGGMNK